MDFSKFKPSDWLMVVGGAAMLILGFALDWAKYGGVSGNGPFDYFFTGGIAWLLVVAVGVVAFLLAGGILKQSGVPWPLVLVLAAGLATLLMLIRVILGGGNEGSGIIEIELDRGIGMFVALISAIVALVGAVMGFLAGGGDLKDLTDINKIKGSFSGSDSAPPPPTV